MKGIYVCIFTVLLVSLSITVYAQADMDDGDGTVPLDGGVSLLLAAGTCLGVLRFLTKSPKSID